MIAVLQRVASAQVVVDGERVSRIGAGVLALVGAVAGDGEADVEFMARKICELRIFPDGAGKMNLSVAEVAGEVLLVSQFTLAADTRKGRRPSFDAALEPRTAEPLLSQLGAAVAARGVVVRTGRFGAHMRVELVNDGPVTLILDSRGASARAAGDEAVR